MSDKVTLEVVSGPMKQATFAFDEHDTFLFGRGTDCHARIDMDRLVSRHHFLLEANPPDVRIRDLGSRNGTYVNGVRHGGRARDEDAKQGASRHYPEIDLHDGDKIRVGMTTIHVTIEAPPRQTVLEPLLCDHCGQDVGSEVHQSRQGEYLCQACQSELLASSSGLRQLILKAGRESREAAPPNLAGYDIGEKIGKGGMGVVYKGVRKSDGMTVAIKVMLAKIAVNEKTRRLFLREIDITRQLDHPHIVSLLDSGAAGSAFYFIMDYCGGGSIEHLVQRHGNKLPLPLAAPLLLQCLDGLEYAHQAGIIHRDLKPQNILLDNRDGQTMARIADFGLAKSMASAGLSGMTATGTYGGSYRFMPREQIVSFKFFRPVSDLWSLVATFYNILTGQFALDFPPDRDPVDIVLSEQAVPLRQRDASMSPAVAKVIDRALLPTVEDRYQSAAELKQALQRALGRSPR
jgi:hypothetical protein